jgi:hypothetical protein
VCLPPSRKDMDQDVSKNSDEGSIQMRERERDITRRQKNIHSEEFRSYILHQILLMWSNEEGTDWLNVDYGWGWYECIQYFSQENMKEQLGKPTRRWRDNTDGSWILSGNIWLCIRLFRGFLNTVMNRWVPQKTGEFLIHLSCCQFHINAFVPWC